MVSADDKLKAFALAVLAELERDKDWGGHTLDFIQREAHEFDLATSDDEGMFVRTHAGGAQICHHGDGHKVTCGGCGNAWCERCDPAPSALCHWCHGRGESFAPIVVDSRRK